jgi:hypothetical protein
MREDFTSMNFICLGSHAVVGFLALSAIVVDRLAAGKLGNRDENMWKHANLRSNLDAYN